MANYLLILLHFKDEEARKIYHQYGHRVQAGTKNSFHVCAGGQVILIILIWDLTADSSAWALHLHPQSGAAVAAAWYYVVAGA